MTDSINTVITLDELTDLSTALDNASAVAPKTPGKRGRKPSADVAARRELTANATSETLRCAKGEKLTVSQIVRLLEGEGLVTKTIWTDVYTFLNTGSHEFLSEGGTGTRTKWFSKVLPVEEVTPEV
jgi:hypothetical protein